MISIWLFTLLSIFHNCCKVFIFNLLISDKKNYQHQMLNTMVALTNEDQ